MSDDEKPWFYWSSPSFSNLGFWWWPSHWKGCLLMVVAVPFFGLAAAVAFSGGPLGFIVSIFIAGPFVWLGYRHSEPTGGGSTRPTFRKFKDDPD